MIVDSTVMKRLVKCWLGCPERPGPQRDRTEPRWFVVDISHERDLARPVGLPEIRESPGLENMVLVNRSRLSVQPVRREEWQIIVKMGGKA